MATVSLRITIKDKGGDFVSQEIARITAMSQEDTKRLADYTATRIRYHIQSAISKNPYGSRTGKLESMWFTETIPNGYGVGDINNLNKETPYWRHFWMGSEAIGAKWQHLLPKGRWQNNRWVADQTGVWFMPSKPIAARNYIENALADVKANERKILEGKI